MTIEMKKSSRSVNHLGYRTGFTHTFGHRGYECKICKKRFDNFQALGGHQGINKKVKSGDDNDACFLSLNITASGSLGLHRCKTCMKEFVTGQALGEHMRQHRLDKTLILMEMEHLWRQQVVEEKAESDLILAAVELQRPKAEEVKRHEVKSELVLAAKEWRLSI